MTNYVGLGIEPKPHGKIDISYAKSGKNEKDGNEFAVFFEMSPPKRNE